MATVLQFCFTSVLASIVLARREEAGVCDQQINSILSLCMVEDEDILGIGLFSNRG